jgi:CubicO group peptidase (beta-lactamase class C family)
MNGKLLKPSTFTMMGSPQKASDGSEDFYGMGLTASKLSGNEMVGHSGGQQGTSTMIVMIPAKKLGVVVLANMDGVAANKLAMDIASMLLAAQ